MQEPIRFASAGEDIKIWDFSSMTVLEQFNPHNSPSGISSLSWSNNNNYLASAAGSGDKIVVSVCKSRSVPIMELAEREKQTFVHLHSQSQYLVSGGLNNVVNIWELKSRRLYRSLKDHKSEVTCVRFDVHGSCLASGSTSGEIILHDVSSNLFSAPFGHGVTQSIRHLRYSYLSKAVLGSVSHTGDVTLWNANSQKPYHTFPAEHKRQVTEICFSPVNERLFATSGLDKKIILYDGSEKTAFRTVASDSPLTAADFTSDGVSLIVGSSYGTISRYDLRMLKSATKTVDAYRSSVQSIQFQHSGAYASGRRGSLGRSSLCSVNRRSSHKGSSTSGGGRLSDTGICYIANQDVSSSKKEFENGVDLNFTDTYRRSSLGDVFTVLEGIAKVKVNEDITSKVSENKANVDNVDRIDGTLTAVQTNEIKAMIAESAEEVREACHRDIIHLQVEMIKQFTIQLNEMNHLLLKYSLTDSLASENETLPEKNKRFHASYLL